MPIFYYAALIMLPQDSCNISMLYPKTATFHLDFGSEIVEQAGYQRLTLYSFENLKLADKALGRTKGD
jgi:hypothetical protein